MNELLKLVEQYLGIVAERQKALREKPAVYPTDEDYELYEKIVELLPFDLPVCLDFTEEELDRTGWNSAMFKANRWDIDNCKDCIVYLDRYSRDCGDYIFFYKYIDDHRYAFPLSWTNIRKIEAIPYENLFEGDTL